MRANDQVRVGRRPHPETVALLWGRSGAAVTINNPATELFIAAQVDAGIAGSVRGGVIEQTRIATVAASLRVRFHPRSRLDQCGFCGRAPPA
jgi:hypothetical protein